MLLAERRNETLFDAIQRACHFGESAAIMSINPCDYDVNRPIGGI